MTSKDGTQTEVWRHAWQLGLDEEVTAQSMVQGMTATEMFHWPAQSAATRRPLPSAPQQHHSRCSIEAPRPPAAPPLLALAPPPFRRTTSLSGHSSGPASLSM